MPSEISFGGGYMYSLRKIKELKKYRFFQNYKWDEADCKLFKNTI